MTIATLSHPPPNCMVYIHPQPLRHSCTRNPFSIVLSVPLILNWMVVQHLVLVSDLNLLVVDDYAPHVYIGMCQRNEERRTVDQQRASSPTLPHYARTNCSDHGQVYSSSSRSSRRGVVANGQNRHFISEKFIEFIMHRCSILWTASELCIYIVHRNLAVGHDRV